MNAIGRFAPTRRSFVAMLAAPLAATAGAAAGSPCAGAAQPAELRALPSPHGFEALWDRLRQAVEGNGLHVVTEASASRGAAARGIRIPGNAVVGVFRNDFAVRMLEASIPAGIEAPLRFYITENADGTATLTYRMPSAVFGPYGAPGLDALARELDALWDKIARDAVAER